MLFVVLLAVAVTPAAATDLTYTGQKILITQPGTYVLKNDIRDSTQMICIEIQASNVVFDGAGHLIDGKDTEHSAGIYVHGPSAAATGVTIKNVRMTDWYYGVYLHDADNSKVQTSTLSSNGYCGIVAYKNAVGNAITGNTVTGNQYGVVFSDGAGNAVVSDNQITQNDLGLYVYLSDGITVTRNKVLNNINSGIQFHTSGGGKIYDNNLNNNLNVAFTGEPFKANEWSTTPGANWSPANIINGPKVGGNYWSRPDGTGFSQTNVDANKDGFIDIAFQIAEQNYDYYPLAVYTGPTPVTTTPTASPQTPYTTVNLPGRLQAENYDNGGEGVAYHDVEPANLGGAGRTNEGVDVESAGGVTNIGYIRTDEWTEYTVNVPTTGTYPATFRVAGWTTGRQIAVSVDGVQKATVAVPNSGSYNAWRTVTVQLPLEAGQRVLQFKFNGNSQNLDYVDFGTPAGVTTPVTTIITQQPGQTAYNGPHALPGTVQAEDFDNGGQNVAYYDSTVENKAANTAGVTAYRPNEYVDAETAGGISNLGWVVDGEWTEYTVQVAAAGDYTANFRVASWANSRQVRLTVDGNPGCTITVPNTQSSSVYQTVSAPLTLPAGTHVIRLFFVTSGQNIDWFSVTGGPITTITTEVPNTTVPNTTVTTPTTTIPSGDQTPYRTFNAPCRVEAEDYDLGGENVAYHDTTPENQGMDYRLTEGVDVDAGGVRHVGYVQTGEWIEYTVNVPAAGTYPTDFSVGSWYPELGQRSIAVQVNGADKGTVNVPITGTDKLYQTVTVPLALDAGQQTIRLTFTGPRQNLDWFEIRTGTGPVTTTTVVPDTTTVVTTTTTSTQTPGGRNVPGRIEAEMFDDGGSRVSYYDLTAGNLGNWKVRNTDVDIESNNGIVNIAYINSWEWLEYTVNVAETGNYNVAFRTGSWGTTLDPLDKTHTQYTTQRKLGVRFDSEPDREFLVPLTGSSSAFQTSSLSSPVYLTAGTHEVGILFLGDKQNFDWMEFTKVS